MSLTDARAITMHRSGSGPPVVLVHCLGVDHRFWDFAVPLGGIFTLLRYDLPGHGATPVPSQPYGIQDLSKQLAGLFRQHDLSLLVQEQEPDPERAWSIAWCSSIRRRAIPTRCAACGPSGPRPPGLPASRP